MSASGRSNALRDVCGVCVSCTALAHTGERLPWLVASSLTRVHGAGGKLGTRP